jgi:hypothetical protein
MNTKYTHKRGIFVSRNHETLSFGHTGIADTDASSKDGYWFLADGMERAKLVDKNDVWFDEDGYNAKSLYCMQLI